MFVFFELYGDHLNLHFLTPPFPTRRSSCLVARGDAAVGPYDAVEGGRLGHIVGGAGILPYGVISLEVGKRQVMRMDMLARRNVLPRDPDDLEIGRAHV